MFSKVRNVVIAVNDTQEAAKEYTDRFGLKVIRSVARPELGIKNAMFNIGDTLIELIEPFEPGQGPVARFLQNRGEGLYMLEMEVDNLDTAVKALQEKDVRLIGADPESRAKGSQVFIHPQSTRGVLIQLIQKE